MPRPATMSKADLLGKLARVFRQAGFDGASMAELSAITGLSKASLYHHFPDGKAEMAQQVLVEEGRRLQQLVLKPLDNLSDPVAALTISLRGVGEFYEGSAPQCLMNSVMFGQGASLFKKDIATVVAIWQARLGAAYREAGTDEQEADAWSAYALQRIQGALILCRVVTDREPLETCLAELRADIEFLAAA